MDDKGLINLLETELDREPGVDAIDIGVSVERGGAILDGFVRSCAEKVRAAPAARLASAETTS